MKNKKKEMRLEYIEWCDAITIKKGWSTINISCLRVSLILKKVRKINTQK
jgi:hypothetical protein